MALRPRTAPALVMALVMAGAALPGGATAGAAPPVKLPATDLLDLQSRQERIGDHWRFLSTTDDVTTGDQPSHQVNRQTFDIEVIGLDSQAITLRYTLREVEVRDDSQPGIDKAAKAWIGIPVEFEARQGYNPYRLTDWPRVREAYFKALDRLAPGDAALKAQVEAYFGKLEGGDPEDMAREVLGDVVILAGMQQVAAPRKRTDFPAQTRDLGQGRRLVITGWLGLDSEDAARCEATWSRNTNRTVSAQSTLFQGDLTTTATLSTLDGWVLSLKETDVTAYEGQNERKTVTLSRVGPAPGCG